MAVSRTSDFLYDFACNPCGDEGVNKEADKFCQDCNEYFCKSCFKLHMRAADLRDHQVFDKEDFGKIATKPNKTRKSNLPTEKCSRHGVKPVDMYCEDHDTVGCTTCISVEHRSCNSVLYIPDIADCRVKKQNVQGMYRNSSNQKNKITELKQERLNHVSTLQKELKSELDKVQMRRKTINEYLDEQENATKRKIVEKVTEFEQKLNEDVRECDNSIKSLETMDLKLKKAESINTSQTFVVLKWAEKLIRDVESETKKCVEEENNLLDIHFEEGNAVSEILSQCPLFGTVEAGKISPRSLKPDSTIRCGNANKGLECRDLCVLPSGRIIITDVANMQIILLQPDKRDRLQCKESNFVTFSHSPWGICTLNDQEVAVTVPEERKVYFVNVQGQITVSKSFQVECMCHSIAYIKGCLYVAHQFESKLTIYDLKGNLLQKILHDQTGRPLFKQPCNICLSPEHKIAVAGGWSGLVVIGLSGEFITRYSYCASGVCVDDKGTIYMLDSENRRVAVLDKGKRFTTLLSGLTSTPVAIFFEKRSKKLFVMDQGSSIQTYSIQYVTKYVQKGGKLSRLYRLNRTDHETFSF